jgi:hypothetical protein
MVIQALEFEPVGPQNQWVDVMFLTVLLPENAKVGLSNSRVDAEGEVDVALKNILRLSQNATIDGKLMNFMS